MKKAELLKLGLDEDTAKKVIVLHGKSTEEKKAALETAAADIAAAKAETETIQAQLSDANKAIADFEKMDVEAIKAATAEYKEKFEAAEKESVEKIAALKLTHKIDEGLNKAAVVNIKAVRALLNYDDIIMDDKGELVGLDKQVEALKESDPNQFTPDKDIPRLLDKTNNKTVVGDKMTASILEGANLSTEKG